MHIGIMAAGAIGGYLGARLTAAGEQVSLIARGKNLDAIKSGGMRVKSVTGDVTAQPALVTDDPKQVGRADIVIFAVKLWDTETAAETMKPMIGPQTLVVPFQNGVETAGRLSAVLGPEPVMGGVAYISAGLAEPGLVQHNGAFANFLIGAAGGKAHGRLDEFAGICQSAGINTVVVPNIDAQLWKKLVFFSAVSGLTAAARTTLGAIRGDEDMFRVFKAAMEETAAVANAMKVGLEKDVVGTTLQTVAGMPDAIRATMAYDLDAGRKLEAYWLGGAVSRLGREAGIATPVNDTLYAAVRPFVNGSG